MDWHVLELKDGIIVVDILCVDERKMPGRLAFTSVLGRHQQDRASNDGHGTAIQGRVTS